MQQLNLKVADDKLEKIANVSPISAIEELIWNGLDADASNVKVSFLLNDMKGIDQIKVFDDGIGISFEQGKFAFGSLGGSPKKTKRKSPSGRLFHGKEGEGRYKAFKLGREITWKSVFKDKERKLKAFEIQADAATRSHPVMSDIVDKKDGLTGVEVVINTVDDTCLSLLDHTVTEKLTLRLASYLMGYSNVVVEYDCQRIDPNSKLLGKKEVDLAENVDGKAVNGSLLICEWRGGKHKGLFLCNEAGIILEEANDLFNWDLSCTAYLKSKLFENLANEGKLDIYKLFPEAKALTEAAYKSLRSYFKNRLKDKAVSLVAQLKNEKIYPYKNKPVDAVEEMERQVFDICAVKVYEGLPSFSGTEKKQKEFTLSLIKEAIEAGPSALKQILQKVLALTRY